MQQTTPRNEKNEPTPDTDSASLIDALAATGLSDDRPAGSDPAALPAGVNPGQDTEHDEGHAKRARERLETDPPKEF